jgi:very-short-patch-repair endonuclease
LRGGIKGEVTTELMNNRGVLAGQRVSREKLLQAKMMRRNMTEEELILWEALRGKRLEGLHFRRQQVIDGFIADFYCHGSGLVLEVDGPSHLKQGEYDEERTKLFSSRGLRVLRVTNEEVRAALPEVLMRIREHART